MHKKVISIRLIALLVIGLDAPVFGQQAQVGVGGRAQPTASEAEYLELIDEHESPLIIPRSTLSSVGRPAWVPRSGLTS